MTTTTKEVQDLGDLEELALSQEKKPTCLVQEEMQIINPRIQATWITQTTKGSHQATQTTLATSQATQVCLARVAIQLTIRQWGYLPISMLEMVLQTIPI